MIDIAIISSGKTQKHRDLTQNAINSLIACDNYPKRIIVIEDHPNTTYANALTFADPREFNYNDRANAAFSWFQRNGLGNFFAFSNNDVLFKPNSIQNLISEMHAHHAQSASGTCPRVNYHKMQAETKEGYNVGGEYTGWFLCHAAKWYSENMHPLPTATKFWCSDNLSVRKLLEKKGKHILVKDAIIEHLVSKSHDLAPKNGDYTKGDVERYNEYLKRRKI